MDRRAMLRKSGCALLLTIAPARADAAGRSMLVQAENGADDFYELLNDARAAFYAEEYRRACDLYNQTFGRLSERHPSAVRAEVLEDLSRVKNILHDARETVVRHRLAVEGNASDGEGGYWFAFALTRAGLDDEALAEYEKALALGFHDTASCWLGIGLSHYRQGRYQHALPWLERIRLESDEATEKTLGRIGISTYRPALEHCVLIYCRLGRVRDAEKAARECIRLYGRLGLRERRALLRISVGADALYVAHYG